jgi:hypothetical protein
MHHATTLLFVASLISFGTACAPPTATGEHANPSPPMDEAVDKGAALDAGPTEPDASVARSDAAPGGRAASNEPGHVVGPIPLSACSSAGTYLVTTTIGTQSFHLSIDTGSGATGVAAVGCASCTVGNLYSPGPTAVDLHETTILSYLDGTGLSGEAFRDNVTLGGVRMPPMQFVAATRQQKMFFEPPRMGLECKGDPDVEDGILGLGPSFSNPNGTEGFWDVLSQSQPALANVFALQLCHTSGRLWLGGFDPQTTAKPIQYVPMLVDFPAAKAYAVAVSDLAVSGQSLGFHTSDFGIASVDSGATQFVLPPPIYDALTQAVLTAPAFARVTTDPNFFLNQGCVPMVEDAAALNAALPTVTLTLPAGEGSPITLHLAATESYLRLMSSMQGGSLVCVGVTPMPDGSAGTILGDTVMTSQITVFDRANGRIGFAPQKGCP